MRSAEFLARLMWFAPLVQVAAFIIIGRKLRWSRQPALLAFLAIESWIVVLMLSRVIPREAAILIQLVAASGFLMAELSKLNRIPLNPRIQAAIAGAAICACVLHAGAQPWALDYKLSLFRCDMRIARALAVVAIVAYRAYSPAFERHADSQRNRVCRIGVMWLLVAEAIQGAFVRGGPGMALVAYSPDRWTWIGIATCSAVMLASIGTALAITSASPGTKRAAKRPDGRTVTGLIEIEKVA